MSKLMSIPPRTGVKEKPMNCMIPSHDMYLEKWKSVYRHPFRKHVHLMHGTDLQPTAHTYHVLWSGEQLSPTKVRAMVSTPTDRRKTRKHTRQRYNRHHRMNIHVLWCLPVPNPVMTRAIDNTNNRPSIARIYNKWPNNTIHKLQQSTHHKSCNIIKQKTRSNAYNQLNDLMDILPIELTLLVRLQ